MAQFTKHFVQDLQQDLKIQQCGTIVFNADDLSNVITVDLYNGTEPATLSGTVVGAVICSDGSTVPISNGTVSGNTVTMTLTEACFAIPGPIGVGIQLNSSGVKTTILKAVYNVEKFTTDDVVDPDSRITLSVSDLIDDIADAIATIPASYSDLLAAIAPTFSSSTAYTAGQFVWYDGDLYRFTADHAAGSWTGTDAAAAVMGNGLNADVADLRSATDFIRGTALDYKSLAFTPNTYIANSAAVGQTLQNTSQQSNVSYSSIKYACKKGQQFIVTLSGGSSARAYSFIDSSDKQLMVAADTQDYTNELLVAPADGYLLINNKNTFATPSVRAEYNKTAEDVAELQPIKQNVTIIENLTSDLQYTDGYYYSTGYGNTAQNAACGLYEYIELAPNTTYTIRAPYLDFTYLKNGASEGVKIGTLGSFVDHTDGTYTFTTPNTTNTIKLYITILKANKSRVFLGKTDVIPNDAQSDLFVSIPKLAVNTNMGVNLFVSKSYTSSTAGFGETKFDNVIDAVASITDSSASKPYTVIIEAGTASTPIVYDDWNTEFAGHVAEDAGYVGVKIPSYVTITTTQPTHPDRTVLYFDGHAGISDTMTYNDAYKKCLFHIDGKKMGILIEGVTLRSKDCRYAFHPESGVDGYGVEWALRNCIIDWQGSPHASETGWTGVTAVGVGLGYGGTGHFENCKWLSVTGVTTAIGGHTNGWNPGVSSLPIMPGATITMKNCDFGGYNVFMTNSTGTNELNNILDFYNVVNCSGNDSTGWAEVKIATIFTD